MPEERIQVSVIVPCRNEIQFIDNFLDSIIRQDVGGLSVEFLIADGMSDDGTRSILKQYESVFPALRVLDNPRRSAATGLNAAIREAGGDVLIRMDVHSEYAPDYIQNCIRVLNDTGADNVGGPARTRAEGYLAQAIAIGFQTNFANGGAKFHNPQYEGYADTVPYGCWRKSTLHRVGLFDEAFDRNQDDELNFRITSNRGKIWQSPKIVSWYWPRTKLISLFRQYFQYGFWKVAVIRKHGKSSSWRHLVPGASIACSGLLLVGSIAGGLAGASLMSLTSLILLAVLAASYIALSLGVAVVTALRRGWRFLPILPVVFATYHVSYGLGFLLGLLCHRASEGRQSRVYRVLSSLTR